LDRDLAGPRLAVSSPVLFALFVISLLVTIGLALYAGGALIGIRTTKIESFSVPPHSPYLALPTQPPAPIRVARGTTPPPIPSRAASPVPAGVITNREDATEPQLAPDARFSVRRSRPRI
jgi:hypothetical protein